MYRRAWSPNIILTPRGDRVIWNSAKDASFVKAISSTRKTRTASRSKSIVMQPSKLTIRVCGKRLNIKRAQLNSFFFNETATTEIYTLSLHDALPIYAGAIISGGKGDAGSKTAAMEAAG